jgi:hypothetical protein
MNRQSMQNAQPVEAAQRPGAHYPERTIWIMIDPALLVPELNVCRPTLHRRLPPQTSCSAFADSNSAKYGIDLRMLSRADTSTYTKSTTTRQPPAEPPRDNPTKSRHPKPEAGGVSVLMRGHGFSLSEGTAFANAFYPNPTYR